MSRRDEVSVVAFVHDVALLCIVRVRYREEPLPAKVAPTPRSSSCTVREDGLPHKHYTIRWICSSFRQHEDPIPMHKAARWKRVACSILDNYQTAPEPGASAGWQKPTTRRALAVRASNLGL